MPSCKKELMKLILSFARRPGAAVVDVGVSFIRSRHPPAAAVNRRGEE